MVCSASTSGSEDRPLRTRGKIPVALIAFGIAAGFVVPAYAQLRESAAKTIARTMGNPEFRPKSFRGGTWFGNGDAYLDIEPSASGTGSDIVKYGTASGAREVFVAAS